MPENLNPPERFRSLVLEHVRSYHHHSFESVLAAIRKMIAAPSVEGAAYYDDGVLTVGLADFATRLRSFYDELKSEQQNSVTERKNEILEQILRAAIDEHTASIADARSAEERAKATGEIDALQKVVKHTQVELRRAEHQNRSVRLYLLLLFLAGVFLGAVG